MPRDPGGWRQSPRELGKSSPSRKHLNLFIYFWLPWVFIAAHGLSLVAASGAALCCRAWALEHSLSSHGAWA